MAITLSPIDFQALSYEQIRADLEEFIAAKSDASRWQDFVASGAGQTLVDLIAGLAAYKSNHELVRRKESYLDTASFQSSIYERAFERGVFVLPFDTAIYDLVISAPAGDGNVTITLGEQVGTLSDYEVWANETQTITDGTQATIEVVIGTQTIEVTPYDEIEKFQTIEVTTDKKYPALQLETLVTSTKTLTLTSDMYALADDVAADTVIRRTIDSATKLYVGDGVLGWWDITDGSLTYSVLSFGDDLESKLTGNITLLAGKGTLISQTLTTSPEFGVDKERVRRLGLIYPSDTRVVRDRDYEAVLINQFSTIIEDVYARYEDEPNEEEIVEIIKKDAWGTILLTDSADVDITSSVNVSAANADSSFNIATDKFDVSGLIAGDTILVYGFTDEANNGLHVVSGSPTSAKIITTSTLVTEGAGDTVVVNDSTDDLALVTAHIDERRALGINVTYKNIYDVDTYGTAFPVTLIVNPFTDILTDITAFLATKTKVFMKTDDSDVDIIVATVTIDAANGDNSFNDSGAGFVITNLKAGDLILVEGFTDSTDNGLFTVTGTPTTSKIIVTATLTTEAASNSITIRKETKTNYTAYQIAQDLSKEFDRPFTPHGYVLSGFTGSDPGATLAMTMLEGEAYIRGVTFSISTGDSELAKTYTVSKDTYVDLQSNGTFTYAEVANDAAVPDIPSLHIRIMKVVTNGSEITGVTDMRELESVVLAPNQFLKSISETLLTS